MPGTANSGGRNAKGVQSHVLAGTFRRDRHADHTTPEPPVGTPRSPRPLQGHAKAEWTRMIRRLEHSHTLSIVDDAALYQYVQLHAETEAVQADNASTRKLSETLMLAVAKLEGAELASAVGEIVKLRQVLAKQTTQLRQQRMALRQYLVEFGMTPSARGRVKVPKAAAPKSKVDQFRAGKASA
jgi:P27 family predicted phage terminase small subunit